jgi:hypothetical protein
VEIEKKGEATSKIRNPKPVIDDIFIIKIN